MTTAALVWDPTARVPDWVVLARIDDLLRAGLPVPPAVCPQHEVPDYVAALVAGGHTLTEIARATGVNAARIYRRTR